MEIVKETKEKETEVGKVVEEEVAGRIETLTNQTQMEVENQKENEVEEERITKQLI